jgi:hypothetical protein
MERIRVYAPPIIFLIQDGARQGVASDFESSSQVRQVLESVDWECQIHRIYADSNMGLLIRFDSALKKVFSIVDRCVILEDDVLPSQDFFLFAAAALDDFKEDKRIGMVSGYCETSNKQPILNRYLSRKPKVWGWATWADRLVGYDPKVNEFENRSLLSSFWTLRLRGFSFQESLAWPIRMNRALRISTWDYQWAFHVLSRFGYSLASSTNLISNIGFGEKSTNTALTPPFINFFVPPSQGLPIERKRLDSTLRKDKLEQLRRIILMLSPAGILVIARKVLRF